MTLEARKRSGSGNELMLVECPAYDCDERWELGDGRSRADHFRREHGPEDFGLSPLRREAERL